MELNINGRVYDLEVGEDEVLLDTLRSIGLVSVRRGCDTSNCCVCTVLVDNKPILSCSYLTKRVRNKKILTVEGVREEAKEIAGYIADEGADQCGYCGPAFIMTTIGLKRENSNPTRDESYHYYSGNYCRCTGYEGQMRAVEKYFNDGVLI